MFTTSNAPRHILILGGVARSLVNFRGSLIRELTHRDHRVTAAAGYPDPESLDQLAAWNVAYEPIQVGRTGLNPFADLAFLSSLVGLMRRIRPDILVSYTIKPVVYGLLAAQFARVPRRIAMITGLGYAFADGPGPARKVVRQVVGGALNVSLRLADTLIVQNRDDEAFFRRLVRDPPRLIRVPGTGVELDRYRPAPLPEGPVTFLMIARLLRDKGVEVFAEAARLVKRDHPEARFVLVGRPDTHPAAVSIGEIDRWVQQGSIQYQGPLSDIRPQIAASHVYVLPTAYREGIPRTILEAMAMGRAIITTDTPGCRETVVEGDNGFLIPPRDPAALAAAMSRFLDDPGFIASAGKASLELCRSRFDARLVVPRTADIILGIQGR